MGGREGDSSCEGILILTGRCFGSMSSSSKTGLRTRTGVDLSKTELDALLQIAVQNLNVLREDLEDVDTLLFESESLTSTKKPDLSVKAVIALRSHITLQDLLECFLKAPGKFEFLMILSSFFDDMRASQRSVDSSPLRICRRRTSIVDHRPQSLQVGLDSKIDGVR